MPFHEVRDDIDYDGPGRGRVHRWRGEQVSETVLTPRVIFVVREDRHLRVGTVQNVVNQFTIVCPFRSYRAPNLAKPALSIKKRFLTRMVRKLF